MFCRELFEGREGFLYHWMDAVKALHVFTSDTMTANWKHTLPTEPDRTLTGNSFTRDAKLQWGSYGIKLTVDQQRLSQTHKIVPLDGHYVHNYTRGRFDWETVKSRTKRHANANPSEEFVIGDIKLLHRYITNIEYVSFTANERGAASVDVIRAYGQKWNLPVNIHPDALADFAAYKTDRDHQMHPDILKWFPNYQA